MSYFCATVQLTLCFTAFLLYKYSQLIDICGFLFKSHHVSHHHVPHYYTDYMLFVFYIHIIVSVLYNVCITLFSLCK